LLETGLFLPGIRRRLGGGTAGVLLSLARGHTARPFGDPGRTAPALAKVVQFRAPHLTVTHHLDAVDVRRIERENALDPFAERDLADGERRVQPGIAPRDAHA